MKSLPSDTLAERLKDLRRDRKLTFEQAAEGIKIKKSALYSYEDTEERTAKAPGMKSLIKLARFYGVSIDYLCCQTEARNPSNASGVDGLGLSEEAIERLENWKHKKDFNSANPKYGRVYAHAEIVLQFIDELLCSGYIEQLAEHVMDYRQCLNGVVKNLNHLIANPNSIERAPDPETGEPPNYEIFIGINDMELYGYKAKELFGEIMEHYAEHKKYEVRQLQEKLSEFVGRDYQIWKARDTGGTH